MLGEIVRFVCGDCAWYGHDAEWEVIEVKGFYRKLEAECERCGETMTVEEPAGDPHWRKRTGGFLE